jgi:hypothetical protein
MFEAVCASVPPNITCTTTPGKDFQTIAAQISSSNATTSVIISLLDSGLILQRKVFFGASVIACLALVTAGISYIIIYNSIAIYKKGRETANSDKHLRSLASTVTISTFIGTAVILADAYSTTLVDIGIPTFSRTIVTPGQNWQALQWLALAFALLFGLLVQFKFKARVQASNNNWDFGNNGEIVDNYQNYNY